MFQRALSVSGGGGSIEVYDIIVSWYHPGNTTSFTRTITVNGESVVSDTINGTYYGMNFDSSVNVQVGNRTFTIRSYANQADSMNVYIDLILDGVVLKTMGYYCSNNTSREYTASFNITALM